MTLEQRLNPFEFRADVCPCIVQSLRVLTVLIPLNSGLMFVYRRGEWDRDFGLNPFEFRADVCPQVQIEANNGQVLIPLNSGLMFVSDHPRPLTSCRS